MNWRSLLTCLVQEETADEEQRTGAPTPSRSSEKTIRDSEKVGSDAGVIAQSRGATCNDHRDLGHAEDQECDEGVLPNVKLGQPDACPRGLHRIFSKISFIIFPSASDEEEIQAYIPHYRILPILSGVVIPFCIVLDIPGLRATGTDSSTSQPNPVLLDIGIMLSILCAVFANICLVVRFLERRIKAMTILCIVFLLIHGECTFTFPRCDSATVVRYNQHCGSRYVRNNGRVRIQPVFLGDFLLHHCVHVHQRDTYC